MGDILLAVISRGQVRIEHEVGFALARMPGLRIARLLAVKELSVPDARNTAIAIALREAMKYVFFWDDDIIPRDVHCSQRLQRAIHQNEEIDILGGVYPSKDAMADPIVYASDVMGDGVFWGWKDGGIHPVFMTGTGFTILRTNIVDRLDPESYNVKGLAVPKVFDEDADFSDDAYLAVNAKAANITWYVHGKVVCDQIGLDGHWYRIEDGDESLVNRWLPSTFAEDYLRLDGHTMLHSVPGNHTYEERAAAD